MPGLRPRGYPPLAPGRSLCPGNQRQPGYLPGCGDGPFGNGRGFFLQFVHQPNRRGRLSPEPPPTLRPSINALPRRLVLVPENGRFSDPSRKIRSRKNQHPMERRRRSAAGLVPGHRIRLRPHDRGNAQGRRGRKTGPGFWMWDADGRSMPPPSPETEAIFSGASHPA